eukprot:456774_1
MADRKYEKELRKLTKSQLIKKCKKLKLCNNGTKMQMIDRLLKKRNEKLKKSQERTSQKTILPHKSFIKYNHYHDTNNQLQTQFISEDSLYHDTIYQKDYFLLYQFYNASIYQCNFKTKQWNILTTIPFSPHIRRQFIGISNQNILYMFHHIPDNKNQQITEHNAGYLLRYNINTKQWHKSVEIVHKNLTNVYQRIGAVMCTTHDTIHILTQQSQTDTIAINKKKKKKKIVINHLIWDIKKQKIIKCKQFIFIKFDTRTNRFHYDCLYNRLILISNDWNRGKLMVFICQLSYNNKITCKWSKKPIEFPNAVSFTKSAKNNVFYVFGRILLCFCWSDQRIYCIDWLINNDYILEWIELDFKFPTNAFKGKLQKCDMRSIYSLVSVTLSNDLKSVYFIQPFDTNSWG